MSSEVYQRIRSHPQYQELVRRRNRMAWSLAWITLGLFFGFMLIAAFSPGLLAIPVFGSGVITLAVVIGAVMLVLFWLLTGIYTWYTSQIYDKMSEKILREVTK